MQQKRPQHGGDIYAQYEANKSGRLLDFSANLNPLGMPKEIKQAITENIDCYESYPDPICRELCAKLALNENTQSENIVCGNGAADLIFRLAIGLKPHKALLLAPTFSEYEQALNTVSCEISYFNLNEEKEFAFDEAILNQIKSGLDIIFLCNPNNPTGALVKKESVLKLLKKCEEINAVLVVDECFMDFVENEKAYSISDKISGYKNLVILKAFTKLYSMAGIRLGYLLCSNKDITDAVSNSGQAWSVSAVAQKCGIAALSLNGFAETTKRLVAQNKAYLMENLAFFNIKAYPSAANYILLKSNDTSLDKKLIEHGILIRSCKNYRNLDEHFFRIAVKSKEDNFSLIEAFKKIYKPKNITVIIDGADCCDYENLQFTKLAKHCEMQNNTPIGMETNSLSCIMNMLGAEIASIPTGRAYLEAAAQNIAVGDNDVVLRCNGIEVKNGILLSSCNQPLPKLNYENAELIALSEYKNLLILHDAKKYINSIVTYAPHDNLNKCLNDILPQCDDYLLDKLLKELVLKHNLMPWGQAVKTTAKSFYSIHHIRGAVVCKTEIVKGIAKLLDMYCPDIKGATAEIDTDLNAKATVALSLLNEYDFVLLHINGADEAAHRKNAAQKAAFIKRIEAEVIMYLLENKPSNAEIVVTSDHATNQATGMHKNSKVKRFVF